jgi:hypothetical protein
MPSYKQTVIETLNYCNYVKYDGIYSNYTQIHHTRSHLDQNTPQTMDTVLKYIVNRIHEKFTTYYKIKLKVINL